MDNAEFIPALQEASDRGWSMTFFCSDEGEIYADIPMRDPCRVHIPKVLQAAVFDYACRVVEDFKDALRRQVGAHRE